MHEKSLHGRPHPAAGATRMRALSLLVTALLAACAGPALRLPSPRIEPTPGPIATGAGVADAAAERRAYRQALGALATDTDTIRLVEALRGAMPRATLAAGNQVTILNDGPSTFEAYARAIDDASTHIHVETYTFADDELGSKFADLLIAKRQLGVEVRVIYDAVGSLSSSGELFARMRNAGIEVCEFRPLDSVAALTNGSVNNRDHRKLMIVDGRIAFVGGINISGTYEHGSLPGSGSGPSGPPPDALEDRWRDSQARIEGPAVAQFQALFFATWAQAGGAHVAPSPRYFPTLVPAGTALVAAVASDADGKTAGTMHEIYLQAIEHATRHLWITQAYFIPDRSLRDALTAAARRGVDTRILLPGVSDSALTLHASRSIYGRLLAAGVRIYEHEEAFVHAKTALIDDVVAFVGSSNLDLRSLVHNNEVVAVVIDRGFGATMATTFRRDLESAREITRDAWRHRPWRDRLEERWARLFWYWL